MLTPTKHRGSVGAISTGGHAAGKDNKGRDDKASRMEVRYVHHPSFSLPGTGKRLWGPGREEIPVEPYCLIPELEGSGNTARGTRTTLSRQQEKTLFLRYNYAKYRIKRLLGAPPSTSRQKQLTLWQTRVREVRERIVHANLPLVPAMAKRKRVDGVDFADRISEGYMAVLRAVERFDVSRGFKFSTYACRAIFAALCRLGSKAQTYRRHVPHRYDPAFEVDDYSKRRHTRQRDDAIDTVRLILRRNDAELSDIHKDVVRRRFGLGKAREAQTLSKMGQDLGLSCERVRQISHESLEKLAVVLDEELSS